MLRSLDRKKARQDSGLFLAEGARIIQEGLAQNWTPSVVMASLDSLERDGTSQILSTAKSKGARVLTTSPRLLSTISRKDNPQTVIAAFVQRRGGLSELATSGPRRFVALYEVRDPGNLGTILRTADAAGVSGVILVGACCDPFSVECVRSTMGSIFSTGLAYADVGEFLNWRDRIGAQLVAASMNGSVRHDQVDYAPTSIVMMGNEQSGLPDCLEQSCDQLVRIPMRGSADSLNLAQAAGIMIYAVWKDADYAGTR